MVDNSLSFKINFLNFRFIIIFYKYNGLFFICVLKFEKKLIMLIPLILSLLFNKVVE